MNPKNIISMTDLQKLSLKKLRKMKLPLFVLDQKSKSGGFVIQEMDSHSVTSPQKKEIVPDYKSLGLLWDRPDLSNKKFNRLIKKFDTQENSWAARRLLERAPSALVTKLFSLNELNQILNHIKLRPVFQEAWENAVHYWTQNP